jgi:hypothetical protein
MTDFFSKRSSSSDSKKESKKKGKKRTPGQLDEGPGHKGLFSKLESYEESPKPDRHRQRTMNEFLRRRPKSKSGQIDKAISQKGIEISKLES